MIGHNRLPVYWGSMSLTVDTEGDFVEDGIEHNKLPVNSHNEVLANIEKTSTEHHTLPVNYNAIGSTITRESSPRDKLNHSKLTLEHMKTEGTRHAILACRMRTTLIIFWCSASM